MNVDSFAELANKKRKRWQCDVEQFISGKKTNSHVEKFIEAVWKRGCREVPTGARKTIRFHDWWHTLAEESDASSDDMIEF